MAAGPTLLHATDKAGTKRPIVGSGDFTYEVYHDWGTLPAGLKDGNTHGVAEDSQGQIYVHHTVHATSDRHDTMVVFDAKGTFVQSLGSEFEGGAHGLHIRKEGKSEFLYLCDTKRALVTKVTPSGEVVWQLGYPKESAQYQRERRRHADQGTRRPTSLSRQTATSTSATATARATSISRTARGSISAPSAGRARTPVNSIARTA